MKKLILMLCLIMTVALPVSAMDFSAPPVPPAGEYYMPADTNSFADGLFYVIKTGIEKLKPDISEAARICSALVAVNVLTSLMVNYFSKTGAITELVGALAVSTILLSASNSMLNLGVDTVNELSEYGKMLLPVMTGALAAQGGTATSAALYGGTMFFSSLMSTVISKCLVPMMYVYLCFCVVSRAIRNNTLDNIRGGAKNCSIWTLKTILYIFTGYMTITGVVSGTTDAAALKAAKLTISGAVPVVGGILSDASEAVVVSAGILKNTAGLYGLFAILSVFIGPFLTIGVHYLLLKLTGSICGIISGSKTVELVNDFSGVMGLILAMVGTECLMLLISAVCFMKGVGS